MLLRTVLCLALAGAALLPTASAAADYEDQAGVVRNAWAFWVVHEHDGLIGYFVLAIDGPGWANPDHISAEAIGLVARGPCTRQVDDRGRKVLDCEISGTGRALGPGALQMDPALQSAELTMGRNHVEWAGHGDVIPIVWTPWLIVLPFQAFTGAAALARRATAHGRVLGRQLSNKVVVQETYLIEAAYANACTCSGRSFRGTVRIPLHPEQTR